MRAFLAVVPPREARDKVEAVRDPLRDLAPEGRWVHPSLWHVTIKFLGEIEDDLVPAVADLVNQVTARFESFEVSLGGTGLFPNADRPRVLWMGIGEGAERLTELANAIDEELDGLGFEPDEHGFQAHMTLARFRESFEAGELAGTAGPGEEVCRFEVDSVVLMKSVLRPRGPDYSVIERLPLIPREKPEEGAPA
ncbi:MAG: RNA 2',3'-cyclic phosphodiesterase, partial [Armatimonadetes bacterium]|nr:RNA 2',3'-cyclic phosphodiesterase [Armatimonadota bacterium]